MAWQRAHGVGHCAAAREECLRVHCDPHRATCRRVPGVDAVLPGRHMDVFLSMLGAMLFGAYHHFILVSPDNIGHLPHGSPDAQATFILSAAALALLELASALYGAFRLGSLSVTTKS